MNCSKTQWLMIHDPLDYFDLVLVQIEAKWLPGSSVRSHDSHRFAVWMNSIRRVDELGKVG